jgi:hypothetical protein
MTEYQHLAWGDVLGGQKIIEVHAWPVGILVPARRTFHDQFLSAQEGTVHLAAPGALSLFKIKPRAGSGSVSLIMGLRPDYVGGAAKMAPLRATSAHRVSGRSSTDEPIKFDHRLFRCRGVEILG